MKYAFFLLISATVAFGAEHKLILRFDQSVDITATLSGYDVTRLKQMQGCNTYRVKITSSLSRTNLLAELYAKAAMNSIEENQSSAVMELESESVIDTRTLNLLDARAMFITDGYSDDVSSSEFSEIDARAMFITDGTPSDPSPLYYQYHVYDTRTHLTWPHTTGVGVVVAVIDTGVDIHHEFLVDNIVDGYDFVDDDFDPSETSYGVDTNDNGLMDEGFGHGTHVAGILKTLAPGVSIMPIRVADSDGQAELFDIAAGIRFAVEHGAHVINMSMSIHEPSALLLEALTFATDSNVLVVTSAGNDNAHALSFPADVGEVVTVTSVGPDKTKSAFANYHRRVDVSAPGERIASCHPGDLYVTRSGTSMAAPMVAAEAAIILQLVPGSSISYVTGRIKNWSLGIDWLNPDYKNKIGKGLGDSWNAITVQNL